MSRTLTAELKLTSPTTLDEAFPIKLTNPIADDIAVQAFEAEGVKNDDGTCSISKPFHGSFPLSIPVVGSLHIHETLTVAGSLIATLGLETP